MCGPGEIATRNLFDKARYINMSRTGDRAGSIKTEETTIGLRHSGLPVEWRVQITEALDHLRRRRNLFVKWSPFPHQVKPPSSPPWK
jgi:hypothetical protein